MAGRTLMALGGLLAAAALGGCFAEPAASEEHGSTSSDLVSWNKFAIAHGIVSRIDYLAFDYKLDGCYARALYMSMELAAEGIESNSIFAFAKDDEHELQIPGTGDTWAWHVAPMLVVDRQRSIKVLDPSMAATPLTSSQWLRMMGYGRHDPNRPALRSIPGTAYPRSEEFLEALEVDDGAWDDVPSFRAMGAFETIDVQAACGTMHAYLELEGNDRRRVRAKRSRLLERTEVLVAKLATRRALDASYGDFDAALCASCRMVGDKVVCADTPPDAP